MQFIIDVQVRKGKFIFQHPREEKPFIEFILSKFISLS
jgi:hypothetical protein